ncbi:hypothetical protein [Nostoc sp.]|uniref:hypothetical protein n=1 Tax=Nostoc sp. TaxID=1180 RepID=UPI002FFD0D61
MPSGEFLAWVAEVDSQIVATSGLVFFQRPPYNGNLSGLEAYIMNRLYNSDVARTRNCNSIVKGNYQLCESN